MASAFAFTNELPNALLNKYRNKSPSKSPRNKSTRKPSRKAQRIPNINRTSRHSRNRSPLRPGTQAYNALMHNERSRTPPTSKNAHMNDYRLRQHHNSEMKKLKKQEEKLEQQERKRLQEERKQLNEEQEREMKKLRVQLKKAEMKQREAQKAIDDATKLINLHAQQKAERAARALRRGAADVNMTNAVKKDVEKAVEKAVKSRKKAELQKEAASKEVDELEALLKGLNFGGGRRKTHRKSRK